jgi:hypothetical protein
MSMLQTTIWDIRKLLNIGTPKMAQLALRVFSARFEELVVTRAAQNQITKPVPLPIMPRFSCLSFLVPSVISIRYGGSVWSRTNTFREKCSAARAPAL